MSEHNHDNVTELPITWKELMVMKPEFVYAMQHYVQTEGPFPDGNIQKEDYERFLQVVQS